MPVTVGWRFVFICNSLPLMHCVYKVNLLTVCFCTGIGEYVWVFKNPCSLKKNVVILGFVLTTYPLFSSHHWNYSLYNCGYSRHNRGINQNNPFFLPNVCYFHKFQLKQSEVLLRGFHQRW